MKKTYNGFSSAFGTTRSFININLTDDTSHYCPSEDEIYIESPEDAAFPGCAERDPDPPYSCVGGESGEGALIEGVFAALLYDLTDNVVEAHDCIAAPGSYVRDLIRTCQGYVGGWQRADGADLFAYCAENGIDPDGYFTPRGAYPTAYSESATESGGWSSGRAHAMWVWNMCEKS